MSYKLKEKNIITEKTAITNGVSKSCKDLVKNYNGGKVLDYGFGKLRNTKYMIKNNIIPDILDTNFQIMKNLDEINKLSLGRIYESKEDIRQEEYESILLSFVLNVIPEKNERIKILNNIYNGLKSNGILYLEVRGGNFTKRITYKENYNDGFIVGKNKEKTFQKEYAEDEIIDFLSKNKFNVISLKKETQSIILICKKKKR